MSQEPAVLVVDDEHAVLRLLRNELVSAGFRALTASTGQEALRLVQDHRPDLVVLDLMLPDMPGFEVLRGIRDRSDVPVIVLSGVSGDTSKVQGLDLGADDYMTKPFNPDEFLARVRAVLRRERLAEIEPEGPVVYVRDLEIDPGRRIVRRNGQILTLSRSEWNLLHYLVSNAGRVLLSAEILSRVWGPEHRDDLQYLRVWISRLRSKLGEAGAEESVIRTVPGVGYTFERVRGTQNGDRGEQLQQGA